MLFNNTRKKGKTRYHYGTAKKARETIQYLQNRPYAEQIRVAHTMISRAKYHARQTANMREAIQVYSQFLKSLPKKRTG